MQRLVNIAVAFVVAVAFSASALLTGGTAAATTCTPTGFFQDGINLTAAQVGADVTAPLDATTCNIGVYYDNHHTGNVTGANISGANYYGVLVDGANGSVTVNVTGSSIHDIGETPLNGSQHGVAIAFLNGASGIIDGNSIWNYQKNGMKISGTTSGTATSASVTNNTVTGSGQIDWIAQNGIQVSYGATALVTGNTVSGNYYTPTSWVACGLLFYQAGGVKASNNTLFGNEKNVCSVGRGGGHFNQ